MFVQARADYRCTERTRRKVSERFMTSGTSSKLLPRSAARPSVSGMLCSYNRYRAISWVSFSGVLRS
jgi:hypothetical protein